MKSFTAENSQSLAQSEAESAMLSQDSCIVEIENVIPNMQVGPQNKLKADDLMQQIRASIGNNSGLASEIQSILNKAKSNAQTQQTKKQAPGITGCQSTKNNINSPNFFQFEYNSPNFEISQIICKVCNFTGEPMRYKNNPEFANCLNCGTFINTQTETYALRSNGEKAYFRVENELDTVLKNMLVRSIPVEKIYNPKSEYSSIRRTVIDWMCELCQLLNFQEETTQHAISLFDLVLSNQENSELICDLFISKENGRKFGQVVQQIATVATLISAKYLEKTYPAVEKLIEIIRSPFSFDEFIETESIILKFLGWELNFTTTYDLVLHYIAQGILFSTDQVYNIDKFIRANQKAATYVKKYALFFTDLCAQDQSFLQYERNTLACGILMASRKMIRIKEKWTCELEALTSGFVQVSKVKRCMHHIFEFYEETFPDHNLKATTDFTLKNSKTSEQSHRDSQSTMVARDSEVTTDIDTPSVVCTSGAKPKKINQHVQQNSQPYDIIQQLKNEIEKPMILKKSSTKSNISTARLPQRPVSAVKTKPPSRNQGLGVVKTSEISIHQQPKSKPPTILQQGNVKIIRRVAGQTQSDVLNTSGAECKAYNRATKSSLQRYNSTRQMRPNGNQQDGMNKSTERSFVGGYQNSKNASFEGRAPNRFGRTQMAFQIAGKSRDKVAVGITMARQGSMSRLKSRKVQAEKSFSRDRTEFYVPSMSNILGKTTSRKPLQTIASRNQLQMGGMSSRTGPIKVLPQTTKNCGGKPPVRSQF